MAINGFPAAIQNVIEQQNYLNKKFEKAILPAMVFRAACGVDWFDARIGESKTFTRSALIAPNTTPLNPANNTGLDNGLSLDARSFEQWNAYLDEWAGGLNLNVLGAQDLLADLFIDNLEKLAQKAANSLELIAAQRISTAYADSGDSFLTVAASAASTITVDNINGFTTQYASSVSPSYGLPQAVSSTNKLPVLLVNPTTLAIVGTANVQGFTAVSSFGPSSLTSGALAIGQSGTLTLDAAVTAPIGTKIVAMDTSNPTVTAFLNQYRDGSYVVRPLTGGLSGQMVQTAYQMAVGNTLLPTVQFPMAASIMRRRGVPKMKNGMYGVAVDPTLMSYLYQDSGFQIATQGTWDKSRVFTNGIIAKGWGLEFVEATQIPTYVAPAGGFMLRHAYVFGQDAITEHPFIGAKAARDQAARFGDIVDVRWANRIQFINQAPLDRLNEVVKMSYKYTGDFEPGTDKGSNPNTVLTSDFARYKRCVIIQAASAI